MSFIGSVELFELECFEEEDPAPYQRGDKLIKDVALSRGER